MSRTGFLGTDLEPSAKIPRQPNESDFATKRNAPNLFRVMGPVEHPARLARREPFPLSKASEACQSRRLPRREAEAGNIPRRRGTTKLEQSSFSGKCSCFADSSAISSKYCGMTVTGCVSSRSDWSVGASCGPQATSGTVSLTRARLSMLLEGIDWRRAERTWEPQLSVTCKGPQPLRIVFVHDRPPGPLARLVRSRM